jgi:hypothetical protein
MERCRLTFLASGNGEAAVQRRPRVPFDPSGSCEIYRLLSCGQFVLALESTLLRLLDMGYIEAAGVHRMHITAAGRAIGDAFLGGRTHKVKVADSLDIDPDAVEERASIEVRTLTTARYRFLSELN